MMDPQSITNNLLSFESTETQYCLSSSKKPEHTSCP